MMDYCGPRGIPRSVFLNQWSEDDQDAAMAWLIDQANRCPYCGSYPDDWMDEDGRPVKPPPMYARTEKCQGCVTVSRQEDAIRASDGDSHGMPVGMRVFLSRQPPPPRDESD